MKAVTIHVFFNILKYTETNIFFVTSFKVHLYLILKPYFTSSMSVSVKISSELWIYHRYPTLHS